jgi:glycosyltransferase involved in cell wall biosynthesis
MACPAIAVAAAGEAELRRVSWPHYSGEWNRSCDFDRPAVAPIDWPEPFGLAMIEAMACGTPVIAFNRGSVPEVIEDGLTGYLVEDETSAIGAVCGLQRLSRSGIRMRFEERFTARRMAE